MRELSELTSVDDPAWPHVSRMIADSPVDVAVLAPDAGQCAAALLQLQVTVRSWLGAVVMNTGGLLVDHGWLRVYGGVQSPAGLPSIAQVNGFPESPDPEWQPAGGLVLAHDVLGGAFSLNLPDPAAHGRPGAPGEVLYFAPDSLQWESLECGYGAWLSWILPGGLEWFAMGLRWPGWETESAGLGMAQGISVVPALWSAEAHQDLAATSRKPVPLRELLARHGEFARQRGGHDPGFLGHIP